MTRYLSGKPLEDFAFLGVAERFSDSLNAFSRRFCGGRALAEVRDNANPDRLTDRYRMPRVERDRLLELNKEDVARYQAAQERLDA
jgi:hypothetical protein